MKNVTQLLLFFCITLHGAAQGVFSNQTSTALQQVIADFPNHFRNIKGDRITEYAVGADYQSKVQIPGAIACVISEDGVKKDIFAWKSELYQTTDFETASEKYKELYNQIHNTIIKVQGEKPVILNGKYEIPDNDKKSTSIAFQVLPATSHMRKLKVELILSQESSSWKISLLVYEQDGQTDLVAEQ